MGYVRYNTANEITHRAWIRGEEFTPQWIFNNLSRSYYNSLLGIDLNKNPELAPEGWFVDQDFIPRRSTSASIVIKGVKTGENPDLTVMWTILGYPPCGIAVPLFVAAGKDQPAYMLKRADNDNCLMCDQALARRARIFPLKRGNGKNYFDIGLAQFFMHAFYRLEDNNFQVTEPLMEKSYAAGKLDRSELKNLYDKILWEEPTL